MTSTSPRFSFSRVPGFDTWTGDKRVRSDIRRKQFVCFVIDLESLRGAGFASDNLATTKAAADHFAEKFEFPNGAKP